MRGVKAVYTWLADRLGYGSEETTSDSEKREHEAISQDASRAIQRADRVIDVWNEQIKQSWRGDSA